MIEIIVEGSDAREMSEHFSHRGIGFQKTSKGYWFFDNPPALGGYWSRFAKDDELPILDETCEDDSHARKIICNMIDRQIAGQVQYTGDIRFRAFTAAQAASEQR